MDSTLPVVVMTAWGSVELAVEAMHRGARDFIQKPWDNPRLLSIVSTQIELGRAPCSADFSTGRGGLLQLLSMPLSPCCPYHPAGLTCRCSQSAPGHAAFTRGKRARPPGF